MELAPLIASAHRFADRHQAGVELGARLRGYAGRSDVVVLGLPRGGVPVAFEVARTLRAPLDVFVVRKLGVPGYSELAMGAIASGGVRVLSSDLISHLRIPESAIAAVADQEMRELARRERAYRGERPPVPLSGRIVILVDDGLATGSTMRAAAQAVRQFNPARVIVAAPVGAYESCRDLQRDADEVVCARTPEPFSAVGQWYVDFSQTTDDEVQALLAFSAERATPGAA